MRGWFIGPSLIVDADWANPLNGPMKKFADIGLAADTGYQVLIADDISLGIGVGVQGIAHDVEDSRSAIPRAYDSRIAKSDPRVLLSFGWAF